MNITIKIDAPELATAIEKLAVALSGAGNLVPILDTLEVPTTEK